eukprot:TRINITY_DN6658_c0_g1_i2.p1 TRINITY_DN6658_c0_g1~~TRINITY_DN6658_c0_g1_i2.p1  ORF type:complete len:1019 (-),score=100.99 TRINITY_DN6658_c0_g1_i2:124-3141(-)
MERGRLQSVVGCGVLLVLADGQGVSRFGRSGGDPGGPQWPTSLELGSAAPTIAEDMATSRTSSPSSRSTGDLICGNAVAVEQIGNRSVRCPSDCPFFAPQRAYCTLNCAIASECEKNHAKPDTNRDVCVWCEGTGCVKCVHPKVKQSCVQCSDSYILEGGECIRSSGSFLGSLVFGLIFCFFALVVGVYGCHLYTRPVITIKEIRRATPNLSPSRPEQKTNNVSNFVAKIRGLVSIAVGYLSYRWPITTNLTKTSVLGPAVLLMFNFQWFVILWSTCMTILWCGVCLAHNVSVLGQGECKRDTTNLLAWCHGEAAVLETADRESQAKMSFLLIGYILSVALLMVYMVKQEILFAWEDQMNSTHKDFTALCTGLPVMKGDEPVEQMLETWFREALGVHVIGVSVCWNFGKHEADVFAQIYGDYDDLVEARAAEFSGGSVWDDMMELSVVYHESDEECADAQRPSVGNEERESNVAAEASSSWAEPQPQQEGKLSQFFKKLEMELLTTPWIQQASRRPNRHVRTIQYRRASLQDDASPAPDVSFLKAMHTSDSCWVVFDSEEARDTAIGLVASMGLQFRGETLKFSQAQTEPSAVIWENWDCKPLSVMVKRFIVGVSATLFVQLVWFFGVYHYVIISTVPLVPSACVVISNFLLYTLCGQAAVMVKFRFHQDRELLYVILYICAILLQVVLDTYNIVKPNQSTDHISYESNIASVSHSASGQAILTYCVPSTFLIPYLGECISYYVLVPVLKSRIVGTQPEMVGVIAEQALEDLPFDLTRYGDLFLNALLLVVGFGYSVDIYFKMLVCLVGSHILILVYDTVRVLRSVPNGSFVGAHMDDCTTMFLSLAFNFLLWLYLHGNRKQQVLGLLAHMFVHAVWKKIVCPLLTPNIEPRPETFEETARVRPMTFFSANPVHCLRSQYIYNHCPPCRLCINGKEHLLEVNKDIGCHYGLDRHACERRRKSLLANGVNELRRGIPAACRTSTTTRVSRRSGRPPTAPEGGVCIS